MSDVAVMYHYVMDDKGWGGIHPLLPKQFEQQIDLLAQSFDIVSPNELDKKAGSKPRCVLTFDDGTKDHFEYAFPILLKKGVPAYFAVLSGPILTGEIPIVHLNHIILSFRSDESIWQLLSQKYNTSHVHEFVLKNNIYHYEHELLRRCNKYILNFMLSEQEARSFLEEIFSEIYSDKKEFIENFYLNNQEIILMDKKGMTIGVHGHSHLPFTGDAKTFFNMEISPCFEYLKETVGITPEWYTPAYGGGSESKRMMTELEPILKKTGFKGGFSTIPSLNKGLNQFWLNRIDCIHLPPQSKLSINEALLCIE